MALKSRLYATKQSFFCALVMAMSLPTRSWADLPPSCDAENALITCAASDVGKACQGSGQCYEISCANGASAMKVYRCDACPTILDVPAGTCTFQNMGAACAGDGGNGTCGVIPYYCNQSAQKVVCFIPADVKPTGPPSAAGTSGSDAGAGAGGGSAGGAAASGGGGGGGCELWPWPVTSVGVGAGLAVLGMSILFATRRRRDRP